MSKSTFIKSTLILTIATLLSKVLGSVFRIPLQNIAGDEVLGIFSLVYPVYMVALILSVAGIPTAISKIIAEARVENNQATIRNIYLTASILSIAFGILSFSLIYSFSSPIADALGGPSTRLALIVVAGTLLIAPYMAVYRGFFQGYEDMRPTAISQVMEQLVRVGLILVAAFYLTRQGFSDETVAGGVMIGSIIGAFVSFIYLRVKYQRSALRARTEEAYSFQTFKVWSKRILMVSIPIAIGAITMALMNLVDSLTIPFGLRATGVENDDIKYLYGIYGRGLALVQIATVFATSLVLPLIPLLTKKLVEKDTTGMKDTIEKTHFMTHLTSWPAALGLFALTIPLNIALFSNMEGSLMLSIFNFSSVFLSLTLVGTGILQGLNKARLAASIIIIGVVTKVIFNIVLINISGLTGAAIATLLVYVVLFIVNTIYIYRNAPFKIVTANTIKIILASIVMGAVIGLPLMTMDVSEWSRFTALLYSAAGIVVGAGIYFISLFLLKVLNKQSLQSLPIINKFWKKSTTTTEKTPTHSERNETMSSKKRIILWIITIVLLLASLPGIINRWQTESENNEYEIVVPYDEIFTLTEEGTVTVDEALSTLKDAGLTTVSVQPITLANWELMGIIQMYTEEELNQLLRFSNHQLDLSQERNGFYITLPSDPYYLDKIKEYFEPEEIPINGMSVYFIPSDNGIGLNTSLGYDEQIINNIKSHGLSYILRVENNDSETNYRDVESITNLNGHTSAVLFSGEEVIGYPEIDELKDHVSTLSDAGYSLYMIEFSAQKGMQTAARETDYDIIRLHSLRIAKDTLPADIDKAVRAIKERNIKTIFFRLPFEEAIQSLEMGVEFIEGVTDKLPDHFTPGVAAPFEKIEIPIWSQIASLLAGVLFMTLAALEVFKDRRLHLAAPIIMAALTVAYLLTDRLAILQVFALLVAVVAPIYAVLSARNLETTNIGKIILAYLKAIAITLVGIMIVVGLLNGNAFITGFEVFRGVKLVYVIPITFVLIFVLWFGNMVNVKSTKAIVTFMNAPVRYWQVIVMLIFAAAAFYYITRTGNAGTVSDLELAFRQKLEDVLYVRPRTKEFLIGFPLFIVGLYIMGMSKWGKLLLVPGVIGFLSIMNTFTHFHIPLGLSLLRTVYSVVLGLVIGLILIAIVKFVINFVRKHWNKELTS